MSRKEDVDEDDYDDYDFDADDGEEDIPMAGFENDPEDDSFRPNIDTPAHEGPSAIPESRQFAAAIVTRLPFYASINDIQSYEYCSRLTTHATRRQRVCNWHCR